MILIPPTQKYNQYFSSVWLGFLLINAFLYLTFIFGNKPPFNFGHLGAEYANIAKSLVEGNGYANPFKYPTGPTSWMPPLLTYFKAFTFLLFGYGKLSYWILTVFKFFELSVTYVVFVKISHKANLKINELLFAFIYIIYLYLAKYDVIFLCVDHGLYNLVLSVLLYYLIDFIRDGKSVLKLSLLYFIVPLSTPAYFIPIVLLTVIVFIIYLLKIRKPEINLSENIKFKHFVLLGIAATISVLLWTYRNYRVFDEVILSKSNTWFEFYISDMKDYEGIVHYSTHYRYHPYRDSLKCKQIESIGEQRWLQQYKDSANIYKNEYAHDYKKKVLNRAYNIFIKLSFPNDNYEAEEAAKLSLGVKNVLCNAYLMQKNFDNEKYSWICMNLSNKEFFDKLKKLGLSNKYNIVKDFNHARSRYIDIKTSLTLTVFGFVLALFPFLSLIGVNIFYSKKIPYVVLIFNVMYLFYFIPFILISYQNRYQELILGFQAYLVSLALWNIIEVVREKIFNT